MILDRVNHEDRRIGTVRRSDVFSAKANFRVVHILVFDKVGRLLLQKIPERRARHPGYWGSSVAGYVFSRETYRTAAERRLRQELGIRNVPLRRIGKTHMVDEGCTKFITVFSTVYEGRLRVNKNHIDTVEYDSLEDVQMMHRRRQRRFTPTFLVVLDFYVKQRRT